MKTLYKLLIILLPAIILMAGTGIYEYLLCKDLTTGKEACGFLFASPLVIGLFWIAILTVIFIIIWSLKEKKYRYLWFSLLSVLFVIIMNLVGLEELLFYYIIIYLVGLYIIKWTYTKQNK